MKDNDQNPGSTTRKANGIEVTDHALVRYIERGYGIDMDELRAEIVTPEMAKLIKQAKTGTFPMGGEFGLRIVVRDKTVITVQK